MKNRRRNRSGRIGRVTTISLATGLLLVLTVAPTLGKQVGTWDLAINAETVPGTSADLNTTSNDGCPIESPDGLSLYTATNRPGGLGGIDIWMAQRATAADPFGDPVLLPAPINSTADDFCPTPVRGKGLFFVSSRAGGCGAGDIYFARLGQSGWTDPVNLGCQVNSAGGEAGPSFFEVDGHGYLYFSSGSGIYVAAQLADGSFGAATPVTELNAGGNALRPNVNKTGLEIVFDSNRAGTLGGQDIYTATRQSTSDPWSTPVNAGSNLNTADNETRASFNWDGSRLYFGRTPGPEGGTDIFVSTR